MNEWTVRIEGTAQADDDAAAVLVEALAMDCPAVSYGPLTASPLPSPLPPPVLARG